ncbi:MAG: hypothetical protein PWQ79_2181 [Thermococcaceae archaeon]|nr:hypothetical protein [Thermococcaceae archaeon]
MPPILHSEILTFLASAAWIVHETKKKILPDDPDMIHLRISAAMQLYLQKKKIYIFRYNACSWITTVVRE